MLGPIDHVGYLVEDLEAGLRRFQWLFDLPVSRHFERPQYALAGAYLGSGHGMIEVFTFTDRPLLQQRLGVAPVVLDHVAYRVSDIDAVAAHLRGVGVRFAGPDLLTEVEEPIELSGVRHLWTIPATSGGYSVQLVERPEPGFGAAIQETIRARCPPEPASRRSQA